MASMDWHRYFGLMLTDFFSDSPYAVELEKDLSLKQQKLDVVIVRKEEGVFNERLPDGLDNLANHNLISFKSHKEALDAWTMKELIGHYVNYRKQVSPSLKQLLPEEEFRLYGVSARYPAQLAGQVDLEQLQDGVYQCRWGTDVVRIIVAGQLPPEAHNALIQLFSAVPQQILFACTHYQPRSPDSSTLIQRLLVYYGAEGIAMPFTMEDFRKIVRQEALAEATPEERLEGLSIQDRLKGLSPEDILKVLPPQEILKVLPPQEIEEYLKKQKGESPPSAS